MEFRKGLFGKYTVAPPVNPYCMTFTSFVEAMKINGVEIKPYKKCFMCGHKFDENETLYSTYVMGEGASRFFCKDCANKINAETSVSNTNIVPVTRQEVFEEPASDGITPVGA